MGTRCKLYQSIIDCYLNGGIAKNFYERGKFEDADIYLQKYFDNLKEVRDSNPREKIGLFRFFVNTLIELPTNPCNPSYVIAQKGADILSKDVIYDYPLRDFPFYIVSYKFDMAKLYLRVYNIRALLNVFLDKYEYVAKIRRRVWKFTNLNISKFKKMKCACFLCFILYLCQAYQDTHFVYNFKEKFFKSFLEEILKTKKNDENAGQYLNHIGCACVHNLIMVKKSTPAHLQVLLSQLGCDIVVRSCCLFCLTTEERYDLLPALMTHPFKNFNELVFHEDCALLDSYSSMVMLWAGGSARVNDKIKKLVVLHSYGRADVLLLYALNDISLNIKSYDSSQGLFFKPFMTNAQLEDYLRKLNIKCVHGFDILNTLVPLYECETYVHFLYTNGVCYKSIAPDVSPFTKKIIWGEEIEAIILLKNSLVNLNEHYKLFETFLVADLNYLLASYEYYGIDLSHENQEIFNTDCAILSNQFNVLTYLLTAGAKFNHNRLTKYVKLLMYPRESTHSELSPFVEYIDNLAGERLKKFDNCKARICKLLKNPNTLTQLCANKIRISLNFPLTRTNYTNILKDQLPCHIESFFFLDYLDFSYISPPSFPIAQRCINCNL